MLDGLVFDLGVFNVATEQSINNPTIFQMSLDEVHFAERNSVQGSNTAFLQKEIPQNIGRHLLVDDLDAALWRKEGQQQHEVVCRWIPHDRALLPHIQQGADELDQIGCVVFEYDEDECGRDLALDVFTVPCGPRKAHQCAEGRCQVSHVQSIIMLFRKSLDGGGVMSTARPHACVSEGFFESSHADLTNKDLLGLSFPCCVGLRPHLPAEFIPEPCNESREVQYDQHKEPEPACHLFHHTNTQQDLGPAVLLSFFELWVL